MNGLVLGILLMLLGLDEIVAEGHVQLRHRKIPADRGTSAVETNRYLTLEAVVHSALESFPQVLAQHQRIKMAAGEKLSAEGGFDTIVKMYSRSSLAGKYQNENVDVGFEQPTDLGGASFFGGYRRGVGRYPVYEGKSETASDGEVRAGVLIPLWRNRSIDRRRATLAQAELGQLVANHEYDQLLLDLERQASLRYWDWVLAGRRLAIARSLLDVARQRNLGLKARITQGDLPKVDAVENQRAVVEREERTVAAERALEQAAIQLSLYLRTPDGEPLKPSVEDLPPGFPKATPHPHPNTERLIDEALGHRPEIRRLEAQIQQAEIERELAKNQKLPGVDLTLSGAQDFGVSDSPLVNRSEFYAGVIIDMPVQQRVAEGREMTSEANLERLKVERRLLEDRIQNEIRDAISAIKASDRRVGLAAEQRQLAVQLEEGEKTRYDLGDSNLMLVNLRELATGDSALTHAEALNSFHRSLAEFRYALGGLGPLREDEAHHRYPVIDYDFDATSVR